jgi:trimeric autotransporter adhesin
MTTTVLLFYHDFNNIIMKNFAKKLFVLVGSILVNFNTFSQAPTNGLVAYYPFNNFLANDESGNGRNGIFSGGVSAIPDRFGNANQAYYFNGVNGNITVPNWNILTGNAARTMSVWFKTTAPTAYRMMLSWGSIGTNLSSSMGILTEGANLPNGLGFTAVFDVALQVVNQNQYFDNIWHLMTFTHDGSTMRLYLDGVQQAERSINATINTTSSNLVIGSYNVNGGYYLGSLDEVRVYNRALSATEVQQTYLAEAPTTSTAEVIRLGADKFISTVGTASTYIGVRAGFQSNSSLSGNTFTGFETGKNNVGSFNVFNGAWAGQSNTTGANNAFLGHRAGEANIGGSFNLFLGNNTNGFGANAATLQRAGAIGYNARVSVNDAIVLGDFQNANLKVGIGVHDPQYRFEISGDINIRKNGSVPGRLRFSSRNFIHADEQDYLVLTAAQPGQSGLRFANLTSQVATTQTTNQFLSLDAEGRVGLFQPLVSARQVRLQVANPLDWADHVFAADYPLPSLKQVGQYIQTNGHLPHLPSAQTMTERGASVEELIKGLVKTQEEQTRYLLQLQAENEQLRKEDAEIRALLKQVLEKK